MNKKIIVYLFSLIYLTTIIELLPISGHQFATSNFIYRSTSSIYAFNTTALSFGPYSISSFSSSTNPYLQPILSIYDLSTYYIQNYQIYYKVKITNLVVNPLLNTTSYAIYIVSWSSISTINVMVMFFRDELLDYFYTGWKQITTTIVFNQASIGYDTINQTVDLGLFYSNSSFQFSRNGSQLCGFQTGIMLQNFEGYDRNGPDIYFSLNNKSSILIKSQYYKSPAAVIPVRSPSRNYLGFSFIIYSKSWLNDNTQIWMNDFFSPPQEYSTGSLTKFSLSVFGLVLPNSGFLYGINSIHHTELTVNKSQLAFDTYRQYFNSSNQQMDVFMKNPSSLDSQRIKWSLTVIYKVICPNVYDLLTNNCTLDCNMAGRFYYNSSLIYSSPFCYTCHYSCGSCTPYSLICDTCDIFMHHRVYNATSSLCIAADGYYENGINVTVAEACYPGCKKCSDSNQSSCIECFNVMGRVQLINGTCKLKSCQTFILWKGDLICLTCDVSNHFVYNSTGLCSCDYGYKEKFLVIGGYQTSYCINTCGDGILVSLNEQCDDGNLQNGDGCNDQCIQQTGFDCSSAPSSKCILNLNIKSFTFNYVFKTQKQHECTLQYTLLPQHPGLIRMDWSRLINLNISNITSSPSFRYNAQKGILLVTFRYSKALQNEYLRSDLTLNSSLVNSFPSSFSLENKLNGLNFALILESEEEQKMFEVSVYLNYVLMVLVLVQFYVGSYFHKMIGLETIQIFQMYFWTKILVSQRSTNLLYSLNVISIAANGYQNSDMFEIDSSITSTFEQNKYSSINDQFLKVGLDQYFLLNVNIFLIPLIIAFIVYLVYNIFKICKKHKFQRSKDQVQKQEFAVQAKNCNYIYSRFIFPYTMMLNMISFFSIIIYLQPFKNSLPSLYQFTQNQNSLIIISLAIHCLIIFVTLFIFLNQSLYTYRLYTYFTSSKKEQQNNFSKIQKFQFDLDSPNSQSNQNYHPLYVLIFLVLMFLFQLIVFFGPLINIGLQLVLAFAFIYLFLIYIWKPYNKIVNSHNKLLVMNYLFLICFVAVCYAIEKLKQLNSTIYISLVGCLLFCMFAVMLGGYARLLIQYKNSKQMEINGQNWKKMNNEIKQQKMEYNIQKPANKYLFTEQLKSLRQKKGLRDQDYSAINKLQQRQIMIQSIKNQLKQNNLKEQFYFMDDHVNNVDRFSMIMLKQRLKKQKSQKQKLIPKQALFNKYSVTNVLSRQQNKGKNQQELQKIVSFLGKPHIKNKIQQQSMNQ